MEQLTRMKKYESLRKSIEMDNSIDSTNTNNRIQDSEELLKQFDSSIFKKAGEPTPNQNGKRIKKPEIKVDEDDRTETDTFNNEYLDDFIKEVREYNNRKESNHRSNDDVDILYQLNPSNCLKRSQYVENIPENQQSNEDVQKIIADEVLSLAQQEADKKNVDSDIINDENISEAAEKTQEILRVINEDATKHREEELNQTLKMDMSSKEIANPEELLREQMNEEEDYETEAVGKHHPVVLNIILGVLIVVIIVLLGFIGYGIWNAGGFNL